MAPAPSPAVRRSSRASAPPLPRGEAPRSRQVEPFVCHPPSLHASLPATRLGRNCTAASHRRSRLHLRQDPPPALGLRAGRKSAWQGLGAAIFPKGGSDVLGRDRAMVFIRRRLAAFRLLFPVLPGVGKSWVERAKKDEGARLGYAAMWRTRVFVPGRGVVKLSSGRGPWRSLPCSVGVAAVEPRGAVGSWFWMGRVAWG